MCTECRSTTEAMPSMTTRSHSLQPFRPQLTSTAFGSSILIARAQRVAVRTYSSADSAPTCHSPYISLPRPQYRTPYGSARPLSRRRPAQAVSPAPLQYSTQASASSRVPVPMFRQMYGSVPSSGQYGKDPAVPQGLDPSPPQARP